MPEYLAPGVYVEEVSFRSKSIEGVSTSTAGFVGPARFGPVSGDPELITSLADFERIFGGLDDLRFTDQSAPQANYLAHAVRAFFEEGGKRLYVSRVFNFGATMLSHYASEVTPVGAAGDPQITLRARFPGAAGNMRVTFELRAGRNALSSVPQDGGGRQLVLTRLAAFDLVHVRQPGGAPNTWAHHPDSAFGLFLATWNELQRRWELIADDGDTVLVSALTDTMEVRPLSVLVEVERPAGSGLRGPESLDEFGFDARGGNPLTDTFAQRPENRLQALTVPFAMTMANGPAGANQIPLVTAQRLLGADVLNTLLDDRAATAARRRSYTLQNGNDGALPIAANYTGNATTFTDFAGSALEHPKNGLLAFEGVEDISIIAAPGYSNGYAGGQANQDRVLAIQNAVINHCERMKYRIAVLDTPPNMLVTEALAFRNQRSSKYAAIYYPWIFVSNPLDGTRLKLPPSGFVAGIYARNDVDRAVFKAPANEVVRLAIDFEQRLNKAQQEVLNPQSVNCFRFFEGRGYLLWGARTMTDDPEWKYVNLRRYFAFLEHSIDRGTQWAVFENNGPALWANVRRTIEDFLFNEWKQGALLGEKPNEAFFVRCDRSTMTQNDLDNGRLICLIGVAPVRPAEFVIFRIGQMTADSRG